jgi:large subunit ribosomal protein L7Ae
MAKKTLSKTNKKVAKKEEPKVQLYDAKPRSFSIGNSIQPSRNVGRFVKWPKYVRLQRQRQVLLRRLKVPPSINQFTETLDKALATQLFSLLKKYKPEDKAQKKQRLAAAAKAKADGGKVESEKPVVLKYGLNHVTQLIESKKATFVAIAHDVDPIELVVYLPALCRKMDVPYCIVKSKSRLGRLVHKKTATCVALTGVKSADQSQFHKLTETINASYKNRFDAIRKTWGGQKMGLKTQVKLEKMAAKKKREAEALNFA